MERVRREQPVQQVLQVHVVRLELQELVVAVTQIALELDHLESAHVMKQ